jgi:hypothetical protein
MTVTHAISRLPILIASLAAMAAQAAGPVDVSGSAAVLHRRLVERTPAGAALVVESGPVLQLQAKLQRSLDGGGALALRATGTGGHTHYDGQTQAGAPLATTTRHFEGAIDGLWRPWRPADWGEAWLSTGWLGHRRDIRGTPTAGGLVETTHTLLAGAMWRSPAVAMRDWRVTFEVEGRVSAYHRLHVDYQGLLDPSRLRGAQRKQAVLRIHAAPTGSPWEWTLEWNNLWQGASDPEPVYRSGALFGTVRQPEMTVRDVGLRVTRRF